MLLCVTPLALLDVRQAEEAAVARAERLANMKRADALQGVLHEDEHYEAELAALEKAERKAIRAKEKAQKEKIRKLQQGVGGRKKGRGKKK